MRLNPDELSGRDLYFAMISIIVPRPIAWVSTLSAGGVPNLAPYSFFTGITSQPPTLVFCAGNKRNGDPKDSARNAIETGEFVVNVVSHTLARQMVQTSREHDYEVDEIELAGLSTVPGERVAPPRILDAPVSIECTLHQVVELEHEGKVTSRMIIGRIVLIHVADRVLDAQGAIDPLRLDAVGRMGGRGQYVRAGEIFEIPRPKS